MVLAVEGCERGRTENSVRETRGRGRVGKSGLLASERSNVSSVRNGNGIRGRVSKIEVLASGKHTSRYGGFSSNGNITFKPSARNVRGWVSNDVSSVRNFLSVHNGNNIRGRVESGRGWVRGRTENSVRNNTGIRGRVGKSMQLLTSESLL